jgi:hypothetical protein
MKKVSIYKFYSFGHDYKLLIERKETDTITSVLGDLNNFLDFIDELDLKVTKSGISQKDFYIEKEKLEKLETEGKGKEKIPAAILASIKTKIEKIDHILDAEIDLKSGFILDEKRYSIEILTEKIEKIFSESTYQLLPTIAQYDFKEAGFCVAFDRYTAAAFHILRGTEDVLKLFNELLLGKKTKINDTWGTYTTGIKSAINSKKITPEPSEELIMNMDNLRIFYRNKTQHPDKIYSLDEVQDLFGVSIKAVNEIIRDLQSRNLV